MLMKLRKERKGFTLIELMIVVAILGVLAAVAIPQYMNYVAASKRRTAMANYDAATRLVIAEFKKAATGTSSATTSVTTDLMQGNRKNPYNGTQDAFFVGTQTNALATVGQVGVTPDDLNAMLVGATCSVSGSYLDEASAVQLLGPLALVKE